MPPDGPSGPEPGTVLGQVTGAISTPAATIPWGAVDDDRVQWRLLTLDGWDSPPADEGAQARTAADGSWDTDNYYSARLITLTGLIVAPSASARERAEARLSQAVPLRGSAIFRLDETTPKFTQVRRSGTLKMSPSTDLVTDVSIGLIAPDPRKYSTNQKSAMLALPETGDGLAPPWTPPVLIPAHPDTSITSVTNAGNFETPPTITLRGPGRDVGLADLTSGWSLIFPGDLAAGQRIVIDVEAGTALLGGTAPRSPQPGSSLVEQCMLAPGTSRLQILGTRTDVDIAATATVAWRDAWI